MSSKNPTPSSLTTTSYAILGLLAIKPWSSYELTQQMDRSLGRFWPRAQSKLYEEPKKLDAEGLARADDESTGRRPRTMYSITAKGRRALKRWLEEPGNGPVIEVEQLLKVFFSDHGSRQGTLAALADTARWAGDQAATALAVGRDYEAGGGRFPERRAQLDLTARFLIDFYAMVADWALWATDVVERWPDDPSEARAEDGLSAEINRRASRVVDQTLRR